MPLHIANTERAILKNLLVCNTPLNPGAPARNTAIAARSKLFLGLHVGSHINPDSVSIAEPKTGVSNLATHPVVGGTNSFNTLTGYHRIPLDNCTMEALPANALEAFSVSQIDGISTQTTSIYNSNIMTFNTALSTWGDVYDWFITDTDNLTTSGNVLIFGALQTKVKVTSGFQLEFRPGAININFV
jgi:hypothetical protein